LLIAAFVVLVFCVLILALLFYKTLKIIEKPTFTLEGPLLPRALAATAARLDQWHTEGRLSPQEYERLTRFIQEDAKTL
jgi:hypothetical protein